MSKEDESLSPDRAELDFDPVPVRGRADGWTAERQCAFIRALRATGCVLEACRRVGMSSQSAYSLYGHPGAASFRSAWNSAVAQPVRTATPSFRRGPSVASIRKAARIARENRAQS